MNAGFPRAELKDLDSFAKEVWGNAQAVLKQINSVNFIDLQRYFLAFQVLLGGAVQHDRILVRDEYRIALQELQTDRYYRGAYVIGQPGIGKTLFLIYALVALLGQKCAVAVQSADGRQFYALFKESSATLHSLDDQNPLFKCGSLWALSDSNKFVESPSGIFCGIPSVVRVIQATSPKASRWKEWSKQTYAKCYAMDIWTEKEIADLAKLLELDVERMTTLAKRWGTVPRTLLCLIEEEDWEIEEEYRRRSKNAVKKCSAMLSAVEDLPDDAPSQFYFVRPLRNEFGVSRRFLSACVPTRTIRGVLGEALLRQDNFVKLDFFRALSQSAVTRQAAGYIYESWFHSFFTEGRTILCHWLQGLDGVRELQGMMTSLSLSTVTALESKRPPYYWIAPTGFAGIDSALVLKDAIFAFQVTISSKHKEPTKGLEKLWKHLPDDLKDVSLGMVFIGQAETDIKRVANEYILKNQTIQRKWTFSCVGWSEVDPIQDNVTYRVFRDESDPMDVDAVAQE